MKKILSFLIIMLAAVISQGQTPAPGIFNYQGVARNSVGNALVNKTINLRLTIHDGAAAGPVVYQESRLATTNPFGLFNVQVGSPGFLTQVGSVAAVNWGVNTKFIQVEIDPNGGTSFINVGTAQIASVPYSLYSSLANDLVLPFNKTQADPGTLFRIVNSGTGSGSTALEGQTNSTAGNAYAIIGRVNSAAPGSFSTGVRGINNGTGGLGIGVWGSQSGSGWGVYGTAPDGIGGNFSSNTGIGVQGVSTSGTAGRLSTTSGLALHTTGGLRLQGILEGPPIAPNLFKLLAGDPLGNATWQHASAIGLVSGSGTLNYVPKWTPNGTTLGNSQIFDNGTNVGIGTITPANKLTVVAGNNDGIAINTTGTNFANAVLAFNNTTTAPAQTNGANIALKSGVGDRALQFFNYTAGLAGTDRIYNFLNNATTSVISVLNNGNVGIGTPTPVHTLEVQGIERINATTVQEGGELRFQEGSLFGAPNHWMIDNFQSFAGGNKFRIWNDAGSMALQMMPTGRVAVGNMVFSDQPQSTLDVEGNMAVGAGYSGTTAAPANGAIIEGNVGIGTNAPGTRLHVVANAGGSATEILRNLSASGFSSTWYLSSAGGNMGHFGYGNPGAGLWTNQMFAGSIAAIPFVFTTSDLERMRISATGNVGIGTNNPITRLHVSGQTTIQDGTQGVNRLFFDNGAGIGTGEWRTPAGAGLVSGSGTLNYIPKWTPDGVTLGNSQMFDNGTNIGLATTTPLGKFHNLSGAAFLNTNMEGTSAAGTWLSLGNTSAGGRWYNIVSTGSGNGEGPGKLVFFQGGAANLATGSIMTMVHANMNVGINTNFPIYKLHVNSGTGFGTQILEAQDANNAGPHLAFLSGGEVGFVDYIRSDYSVGGFAHRQGSLEIRGNSRLNFYPTSLVGTADLAMTVIGNGNVGIGTITPTENLHLTGRMQIDRSSVTVLPAATWVDEDLRINSVDAQLTLYSLQSGLSSGAISFKEVDGAGNLNDQWAMQRRTTGAFDIGYGTGFDPGTTTTLLRLLANGNLGLGTTAPVTRLHVAGQATIADGTEGVGRIFADNGAGVGTGEWRTPAGAGLVSGSGTLNYIPKWTPNGTTLGNSQIFDNGGTVGIGTTAPGYKLEIAANVTVERLTDINDATQFAIAAPGSGYSGGVGTVTNHDLAIFSNNLDRMTITASGDVGVGILTPTNKFEVIQTGTTRAGLFQVNNPASVATALEVNHNGVARAIHAQSNAPGFCNCGVIDGLSTVAGANAVYGRGAGANTWGVYGLSNNSAGTAGIGWLAGSVGVFGQGWLGSGGQFIIDNTFAGNTSNVLEVSNLQTGRAGNFVISNAASTADVIFATTNSTSTTPSAVHAVNGVSGFSIFGKKGVWGESDNGLGIYGTSTSGIGILGSSSTGSAGVYGFNSGGTAAVYAQHVGSGFGVYGFSQSGIAGRFENTNSSNVNHTVNITTNGFGNAIRAFSDKSTSIVGWTGANSGYGSAGVYGLNNSVGGNGLVGWGNRFDDWGLLAHSDSSIGVYGESYYDRAGYFINFGLNNTTANTVEVFNAGKGHGVYAQTGSYFQLANFYNPAAAFKAAGYFRGNAGTGVIGYAPGTFSHTGGGRVGVGVYGIADSVGSNFNYGLAGIGRGSVGENAGVIGFVDGLSAGAFNAGVYGVAFAGPGARYAGYFDGNVQVVGNFAATGVKAFKIDHPLDPANKYLSHYAMESPEVQNVYNGNITTDANGRATVQLPDYFEAVNTDFKYQLTIVDETQFAMSRVSRKINGNQFELMTSVPGIEVSWQVIAVRNDKAAQKFAEPAESLKQGAEKGKYLNPELYGQGKEKGLAAGIKGIPDGPLASNPINDPVPSKKITDLKKQSLTGNTQLPNQASKTDPVAIELSKLQQFNTPAETPVQATAPDAAAEKSRILAASLADLKEAEYKTPVEKKGILSEEEAIKAGGQNVIVPAQTIQKTNEKPVQHTQPATTQIPARIPEYGNKMEQMRNKAGQQNRTATGIPVPSKPDTKQAGLEKAPPPPETKPQPPNRSQKAPEKQLEIVLVKQVAGTAKTD